MAAKEKADLTPDELRSDHPIGTGLGAAGGAIAGATLGSAGGPVGTVVGGVIGAVAGGLAGRGVAEVANPHPTDDQHEHNLGKGLGAGGGAMAGAVVGSAGGPVGAAAGAAIGAVAGGAAGKGMAHAVNHDREDAYWRGAHIHEPYYNPELSYDDYAPAYRMGWESRARYDGGTFEQYEPAFRNDWDVVKGDSRLEWADAKHAARAGWDRIERALPGDADGDGR